MIRLLLWPFKFIGAIMLIMVIGFTILVLGIVWLIARAVNK